MSLVALVTETTRMAPSAPKREACIAPKMLAICCVCRLVRDETGFSPGRERWVTQRTYRKIHSVNPTDFPLTHTYCQTCLTKAQETVRQYAREIGTSP